MVKSEGKGEANTVVANESVKQGIFLKWLFPFLCSFRSNALVNV